MTEAFAPGTRLGPYEITAAIGAGGMGQVFRARDNDHTGWHALPDGRFLMIQAPDRPRASGARLAEILLVFNFPEELKRLVVADKR